VPSAIWDDETAIQTCRDLADLCTHVIRARERLRHKRDVICVCSHHCGYLV
jgi:hypothetical protein